MCGIVGVVAWHESARTGRPLLRQLTDAIAHRGPDGEGIWINHESLISGDTPQVAFGFRRLAILDPDERAMQPMHSADGRYTLVFNGEIYNFRELRARLAELQPDICWRTTGDTEVLLHAFRTWRELCLEHLNGMFAFAVWDGHEQSLFLARDRMGQKPLYVATDQAGVCFASEVRGLGSASLKQPDADDKNAWLQDFLRYGYLANHRPGKYTELQPGEWARFRVGAPIERRRYFSLATSAPGKVSRDDIESAVARSVERQLVSDVPLGVLLSGGIDSSIVALCARKHGPVQTFSIGFDDPRYDESAYAREVAKHLGTDHHQFQVTPDVVHDLPDLVKVFGEPFADSSIIPTLYLARETRKFVKVALSGDGGDELFGGYDRYAAMALANRWRRYVPSKISYLAKSLSGGHPKSKLARAARFVASLALDDADRYDNFMRIFADDLIHDLMINDPASTPQSSAEINAASNRFKVDQRPSRNVAMTYARHRARLGVVESALATDRETYLPGDLLTKVDRCNMLHALEVRSPFMDHELVQLAARLKQTQLIKGGKKKMLREAFAHQLPTSVFNRPKMGFAVPIGQWFRTSLRPFLCDHLFADRSFSRIQLRAGVVEKLVDDHQSRRRDHSQRLFALLVLEIWWKKCESITL